MRPYISALEQHVEKWISKNPGPRRKAADCVLADLLFADQWLDLNDEKVAARCLGNAYRLAESMGIIRHASRMFLC